MPRLLSDAHRDAWLEQRRGEDWPDTVTFEDRVLVARKDHSCSACKKTLPKGERYGRWVGTNPALAIAAGCAKRWPMKNKLEHSSFFDGLPICIVCGQPVLKDCPAVQFAEGVACNRKRSGRRHTCAEAARQGQRWLQGLTALGALLPVDHERRQLEITGPKAPERVEVPTETADLFADYDPAAENRRKFIEGKSQKGC